MAEGREHSFWDRLFSTNIPTYREDRVVGYIVSRIAEGASLHQVTQEEYVRRNASPSEVKEILHSPKLLHTAHEHLHEDFESGELDPHRRPR
jgi:hypothetical protein